MSQIVPFRQVAFLIITLAVVQFIMQISLLTKGLEYAAASLIIDDTYYYLQTAWNAKLLGFVTFDGLHPTNGVQLLWFVIIFFLAVLAESKAVLLFTTLAVGFLLNGLCYFIILKIGAILKQPVLALLMASLWALQSLPFRIYSMGMENSLHALVFWCVIWQSTLFLMRVKNGENPNFWGLTVILILNAWTRLDSALFSALLYAFCMGMLAATSRNGFRIFLQRYRGWIAGTSAVAASGLIAQLLAFQLMGGSLLPVSALVKTSSAGRGTDLEALDKLLGVFTLGMPSILHDRFPALILGLLGISGILLVILTRLVVRDHSEEIRTFVNLWLCLLFGEIVYYLYVALSGAEYTPYFIWYRSPSFIFWIITASFLALYVFQQIKASEHSVHFQKWAPIGLSVGIFTVAVYLFARSINFTSGLYSARYDAALWISENTPSDTVFASWNAGQLGFFSDRTFINLDGVINNVDYYERVLVGSTPLIEYLFENNVDYIVDYDVYSPLPDLQVVRDFPIEDGSGRSIQIWQVAPQASLDR